MKYFTPDLIARGQSEDSRVLSEVETLWDERCAQYDAYLSSIRDELSPGLRHIEDHYYLHDAVVRVMGYRTDQFIIVLQLDTPPRSILSFVYNSLEAPRINTHNFPGAGFSSKDVGESLPAFLGDSLGVPKAIRSRVDVVEWQYDEVEKVPGNPPTWRQSILLSNSWEVVVHFRDIEVTEMHALLPIPVTCTASWMPARLP